MGKDKKGNKYIINGYQIVFQFNMFIFLDFKVWVRGYFNNLKKVEISRWYESLCCRQNIIWNW